MEFVCYVLSPPITSAMGPSIELPPPEKCGIHFINIPPFSLSLSLPPSTTALLPPLPPESWPLHGDSLQMASLRRLCVCVYHCLHFLLHVHASLAYRQCISCTSVAQSVLQWKLYSSVWRYTAHRSEKLAIDSCILVHLTIKTSETCSIYLQIIV